MGRATNRMKRILRAKTRNGMVRAQVENLDFLSNALSVETSPKGDPFNRSSFEDRGEVERSKEGEYPRKDYGDSIRNLQQNGISVSTDERAVAIGFNREATGNGPEDDGAGGVLELWGIFDGQRDEGVASSYNRKDPADAFYENEQQIKAAFRAGAKSGF